MFARPFDRGDLGRREMEWGSGAIRFLLPKTLR
jgi:hypothetical protein